MSSSTVAWFSLLLAIGCTDKGDAGPKDDDTEVPDLEPTDTVPSFYGHVPKNILVFSIDTFRKDRLGKYDPDTNYTPFLGQLMEEGFTLDEHMTCANWTFMGVGCTMNGRYNEENGFIPELGGMKSLMPEGPQVASVLGDLGLYTILVTGNSWFSSQWNMAQGFDEEELTGGAAVNIYNEGQRRLADAQLRGAVQDGWYMQLHVMEPHAPYNPPPEYLTAEADLPPIPWDLSVKAEHYDAGAAYGGLPDAEKSLVLQHMELRYDAEIEYLDDQFLTIFADLTARGLLNDTLVVFWNDHGEQFWEHGNQSHAHKIYGEENDGFMFFWAQNIVPGSWTGPTSQIDYLPTLHGLYGGTDLPPEITGVPLGQAPEDRARFALTSARNNTIQAVRKDQYKMLYTWSTGLVEVYDKVADPGEQVNLYDPTDPIALELWDLLLPHVELADQAVLDENPRWPVELPGPDDTPTTGPGDSGTTGN